MVSGKKLIELLEKSYHAGYTAAMEDVRKEKNGETAPLKLAMKKEMLALIKLGGDDVLKNVVKEWVLDVWGKRCKDYVKGCPLCEAWKCFDYLFGVLDVDE